MVSKQAIESFASFETHTHGMSWWKMFVYYLCRTLHYKCKWGALCAITALSRAHKWWVRLRKVHKLMTTLTLAECAEIAFRIQFVFCVHRKRERTHSQTPFLLLHIHITQNDAFTPCINGSMAAQHTYLHTRANKNANSTLMEENNIVCLSFLLCRSHFFSQKFSSFPTHCSHCAKMNFCCCMKIIVSSTDAVMFSARFVGQKPSYDDCTK